MAGDDDQNGGNRKGGRRAARLPATTERPGDSSANTRKKTGKTPRKRGDEVREAVLRAALECYGAFGYEGTSTRAVADRANVTHTLVLYHFHSKEDLWMAALDKALSVYATMIEPIFANSEELGYGARLRRFIEQFMRFSAEFPQVHRIMTMEGNQDTVRLRWVIDNFLRDHFKHVYELIRHGQDEGTVREFDAARLYYFIISGAGTMFTLSTEYKTLTGRDVFSEAEILRNLAFLYEIVFVDG